MMREEMVSSVQALVCHRKEKKKKSSELTHRNFPVLAVSAEILYPPLLNILFREEFCPVLPRSRCFMQTSKRFA